MRSVLRMRASVGFRFRFVFPVLQTNSRYVHIKQKRFDKYLIIEAGYMNCRTLTYVLTCHIKNRPRSVGDEEGEK